MVLHVSILVLLLSHKAPVEHCELLGTLVSIAVTDICVEVPVSTCAFIHLGWMPEIGFLVKWQNYV